MMKHFLFFALIAAVLVTGCDSSDPEVSDEEPPDLPPTFIFSLNPSLFQGSGKALVGANYTAASIRVGVVTTILSVNLVLPAGLTGSLAGVTPVREGNTWVWRQTADVEGDQYEYALYGTVSGSTTNWEMTVSGPDPFSSTVLDEFTLYTVRSVDFGTAGSWSLYYPQQGNSLNVLNGNYSVVSESEWENIFEIPESFENGGGDSVDYERIGDTQIFFWNEQSSSRTHDIQWDVNTRAGSIRADNYQNGEVGCWDENLNDTPC